jgi:CubicO group peptidase (beta-lactamase class C family)
MNKYTGRLTGAFFALFLATSSFAADLGNPDEVEAFIDGVVEPLMKSNNSPSGVVAIARNGELIFAKGYGFEDIAEGKPVDPYTTLFRPGSVSKLFTWTAVMQLVEEGKLDLDTDVNEYLETFKIKDTFKEPITLRHILTHTSGFEDGGLGYLIIDDPANAIPLRDAMEKYQPERVNPPGKQTAYSNYATALAGLIVANVSGQSFEEYIQRNIFDPLGMQSSSFEEPLPEGLEQHMAASYKVEAGAFVEKPFEIISNFGPAGGQSATATDMLRFAEAIRNGGELDGVSIIQPATLDEMLSRQFTHDDRLMGMAFGFYEQDINGNRVVGHGGDTQYFHSFLGIDKANELTFFISFSASGGSAVRSALGTAIYDEFFPRVEDAPVAPEDFSERAGKYAGTYGFWRGNFSKIERLFSITSVVQVAPTGDNTLMVGFAGNAKQYVEVEDNLFRETSSNISLIPGISPRLIAFQEDEAGQVTGFVMDGLPFMSLRKLPGYATPNFNFTLIGISLLIFLLVVLRRFFQRKEIALMPGPDRSVVNASFYTSLAHLLVVVIGVVVASIAMKSLMNGFPTSFKVWLVLPIIATLLSLYLVFRVIGAWRQGQLASVWARLRLTLVVLAALFMVWFYWYWNVLGFQYL